jgi:hypothetical protein
LFERQFLCHPAYDYSLFLFLPEHVIVIELVSEIAPTAESIFTEEYWNAPPMPEYRSNGMLGRHRQSWKENHLAPGYFDKETIAEAEEMLLFAANLLVAQESVTAIEPGEQIGGPDDTTYATPGAVLLIDREHVFFRPEIYEGLAQEPKNTLQPHELSKSALSAFMSGMTATQYGKPRPTPEEMGLSRYQTMVHNTFQKFIRVDDGGPPPENYAVLNPFKKHFLDANHGRYTRKIDLFAFCNNKKGNLASIRLRQWRNPPGGAHVITYANGSRILSQIGFDHPGTVGETRNVTVNPSFPDFTRIREARICIPGSLEHAKAPAKSSKRSPAKATQPATNKT